MATNKHATIRYHALDQCFGNIGRKYYMEDLIDACSEAIYAYTGKNDGIKRRQVFEDLKFMESDQGWSIPLNRIKDGKRVYYRYSEKNYSIRNQPINETEVKQLKETLSMLTRFKGLPQFEWMEEILIRLESSFRLRGNRSSFVGFDQNIYLRGLNYFTELFNAIQYRKVMEIQYQSFKQSHPKIVILHPYYLKQYNSRWFLFGLNNDLKCLTNLALDRIQKIKEVSIEYIDNEEIDFEEYFDDVIGVTVKENQEPESIMLQVSNKIWPYIETKPIHGSQKIKSKSDQFVILELTLQINYELAANIFSLGEEVKVLAPEELIRIMRTKGETLLKNYL